MEEVLRGLETSADGLAEDEAARRLEKYGRNEIKGQGTASYGRIFLERFRSPLVLILVFAAVIAALVQDWLDAAIVLVIVIVSAAISALQEYRAADAAARLRQRVAVRATVLRCGEEMQVPVAEVVPGDIVVLSAGSLVAADGLLLEANDLYLSQAILTGETFPVEKGPGIFRAEAPLAERGNCVFMGTSVRSGTGRAVIVETGEQTAYGTIARDLTLRPPETEFERGLRHFGGMLMRVMILVVLAVLSLNLVLERPAVDTLLFAMALAVGLSPELLPAILAVTLSRGAQRMAQEGVIVKRLSAIENLGSMDVLCTDKTGTLTKGVVQLDAAVDVAGGESTEVLRLAYLNSRLQRGLKNPLDEAVAARGDAAGLSADGIRKVDEVPYDFVRKRLTVVMEDGRGEDRLVVMKGSVETVLDVCPRVQRADEAAVLDAEARAEIEAKFNAWSDRGFRVLGVAQRRMKVQATYKREDERDFTFAGFLLFFDPPEPGVGETLSSLRDLGVDLKIVTGDSQRVARHVAEAVGLRVERVVVGAELAEMKDEALWNLAPRVSVFAEVEPNQKERIILALRKTGRVVGYLGDGINDAPALHAADAGISVDQAVDVAKEAADFVLLKHDLALVREGIDVGRHTFANTLKYIFITSSANFGNMVSMAAASLFLPFLPLLAKQILLNNLLSDLPAFGIAGDRVDREWERTPHRWDIRMIRNFMVSFGLISSCFDVMTFGTLIYLVGDQAELFRTGWFIESLLTELSIVFIIRTYKPFYLSAPGRLLLWTSVGVGALTVALPYTGAGEPFGLVPLPWHVMAAIFGILAAYLAASELTKNIFYRKFA